MKAIKVNADYESVLFFNKPLPVVNEALEFLAFYIEDRPIITSKKYSDEFLNHVERLTGHRPVLKKEGAFDNWWGELKNIPLEQKLNSKEMSAELNIKEGWCQDTHIISSLSDLPPLDKTYLAKNPYGMSGQNFCLVSEGRLQNLEVMLKHGKVILEPLLDRVYDFSHYVFPDGKIIRYQNLVDKKFQYKGTILSDLPFTHEISKDEWSRFDEALKKIIDHYKHPEMTSGFSVDSFVYREGSELKIRFLSEVNYRKTMGYVAYKLKEKLAPDYLWTCFTLLPQEKSENTFVLSPAGVRFEMSFLRSLTSRELAV